MSGDFALPGGPGLEGSRYRGTRLVVNLVGIAFLATGIGLFLSGCEKRREQERASREAEQLRGQRHFGPPRIEIRGNVDDLPPEFRERLLEKARERFRAYSDRPSGTSSEKKREEDRLFWAFLRRMVGGCALIGVGLMLLAIGNVRALTRRYARAGSQEPEEGADSGAADEAGVGHTCGAKNDPDARFCQGCGMPLRTTCPACGATSLNDTRFCRRCGASLEVSD